MRTVRQITKEYKSINFDFNYKMVSPKTVQVGSWWGSHDLYNNLTSEMRREGYRVIG